MSQKNRNQGGRPKGLPKTGGRKKGVRNKHNIRLRDRFVDEGFDFVREVIHAISKLREPEQKLDALLRLTPFFMQRLRDDVESPEDRLAESEDSLAVSTEDLLKLVGK